MKVRDKHTGEIATLTLSSNGEELLLMKNNEMVTRNVKLSDLEEWEDYEEPKEYSYVLPNKVRRTILSWVKAQDNPIVKISILLKSYYDTKELDSDGFYDYEFYGYVGDNNKNLVANTLSIRLKKPFVFNEYKDYTLPELGIFGGKND